VSTATTLLGSPVSSPVAIAPTAIQGLAHPEGEVATARGAAEVGALLILSSLATCPLEDVAAAAPDAARWMQIYILRERARTEELVRRAAAHGYRALVLTVDAPVSGLRLREWRIGVHLPDDLALPNLAGDSTESAREGGFMAVVTREFEPALTPDDIGWLAGLSSLPVVVKGVQRADDAVRCVDAGAAAVVVSNHGARQLADAPATADILPEVVDAVAGRAEVYVDGGVRRAPDVVKALALGARATWSGDRRCGRWPPVGPRVWRAAALVRIRAAAHHGPLWRRHGRRPRPRPGAPLAGMGACHDDRRRHAGRPRRGRPPGVMDGDGRWSWRQAVHEGATRGALASSLFGDGKPHVGVLLPNGSEYLFWLNGAALAGAAIVGSTRPGGARRWPPTCGPPTAPSSSPTTRAPPFCSGLDLGVDDDNDPRRRQRPLRRPPDAVRRQPEATYLIEHADD
jgi:4-hydroxymandelate oxidase